MTYREALHAAMCQEMDRDDSVFLMGEEVAEYDGAYKVSRGMLERYGPRRVVDSPISELGFTGLCVGAAMTGLRPICEFMTFNFSILALDQVINSAAKMLYMSNGQIPVPIVFRGPTGAALQLSAQHSQACESWYVHAPGIKLVTPATPADAKGLFGRSHSRRRSGGSHGRRASLQRSRRGFPMANMSFPLGVAELKRSGDDISIVTHGKMVHLALQAATALEREGIEADVLDLRSLRPLDADAILATVRRTNRVVYLEEGWPFAGIGAQIVALIQDEAFDHLDCAGAARDPGRCADALCKESRAVGKAGRPRCCRCLQARVVPERTRLRGAQATGETPYRAAQSAGPQPRKQIWQPGFTWRRSLRQWKRARSSGG